MRRWAVLLGILVGSVGLSASARASTEFTVAPAGGLIFSGVAMDGAGDFVVVWDDLLAAPDTRDVFARRYDAAGTALGGPFLVNASTTGFQAFPAIAGDAGGSFVILWRSDATGLSAPDILGQRYDGAGAPLGGEFVVNSTAGGFQTSPAVAVQPTGFVAVWSGAPGDEVFARRFDTAGLPLGPQFAVNSYTTGTQQVPALASDASGNFVVAWADYGPQAEGRPDIYAQRYDSTGAPLGGEFRVNSYTTGDQTYPSVAVSPSGDFVVVWLDLALSGFLSTRAQRYDGAGVALGGEFQVNTYSTNVFTRRPDVAADGAGNFVIVWPVQSDDTSGVFARRYDASGVPLDEELLINTVPLGSQEYRPSIAANGSSFVTVWQSSSGVSGQLNKPDRRIRGKKLSVLDRDGTENGRSVLVLGSERATEIGPGIDGDPTVAGATLRVIANGTNPSDQTFVLDASGWTALGGKGFRYRGPTGADGDPVHLVLLQRTNFGTARIRAVLRGSTGTQTLDVVPPNVGDGGGIVLQIGNGGGTYCVTAGGAAGGAERQDSAQKWVVTNATADACPTP